MARRRPIKREFKLDHKLSLPKIAADLTDALHEYDLDLKSNHIYLMNREMYGVGAGTGDTEEPGIEYSIANRFIRNINLCMRVNPKKPILIHQNVCGGNWEQGMAIYDAIKSCPAPVTILNYSHARSMSSIIFQAANKRVMMPYSHFMYHEGSLELSGTNKGVKTYVKFSKSFDVIALEIYAKMMQRTSKLHNKKSLIDIKRHLQRQMDRFEDVFLSAQESVVEGFADDVFNGNWSQLTKYTPEQLKRK